MRPRPTKTSATHRGEHDRPRDLGFGFNDEIKSIVDTDPDTLEEDLLEAGFAAHPDIVAADHADREWFVLTFAREMEADELLAICIDTLTHAHVELARHMAT